jgi:hypothetical protein
MKFEAEFAQPVDLDVRTLSEPLTDARARAKAGEPAHAGAGDADEVNLQFTRHHHARENLASVHVRYGLSMPSRFIDCSAWLAVSVVTGKAV